MKLNTFLRIATLVGCVIWLPPAFYYLMLEYGHWLHDLLVDFGYTDDEAQGLTFITTGLNLVMMFALLVGWSVSGRPQRFFRSLVGLEGPAQKATAAKHRKAAAAVNSDPRNSKAAKTASGLALTQRRPDPV